MFKGNCCDCNETRGDVVTSVDGNTRCAKHHRQWFDAKLMASTVQRPAVTSNWLQRVFGK